MPFEPLRRFLKRFGPALLATLAAQGVSAASIVLLPWVLSPELADSYAIGLQTGAAGLGGIAIGVIYNVAVGRPGFAAWGRSAVVAAAASPLLAVMTYGLLMLFGTAPAPDSGGLAVIGVFGIGGAGLALGGVYAVRRAVSGRPLALVASTLVPSLALLAGIAAYVSLRGAVPVVLPGVLWAAAAWAQAIILSLRGGSRGSDEPASPTPTGAVGKHASYLAVGALTSTVLPNVYVAALTQLAAGTVAFVFVIGRIGTALVGVGVNTLLTVAYTWSARPSSPLILTRILLTVGSAFGLVALAAGFSGLEQVGYGAAGVSWFALLVGAAVALRDLNSRAEVSLVGIKTGLDLLVSASLAIYLVLHPSITGYFGVYAASQAITLGVASYSFQSTGMRYLAASCFVSSLALVVFGW